MTTIHKPSLAYDLLKVYFDFCVQRSYRNIEVHGIENLPAEGSVILASNHCNTLMDALVILRGHPNLTVFGARADIFNNPTVAKFMTFLRILPMVRERDGLRNVVKNFDTMDQIADVLNDGVAFCFFPEGTHRPKHSLLPIKKGLTRMAIVADEKTDHDKPLYMVPVGVEYGDYFRFRSTSLVNFGKPVELKSLVRASENKDLKFFSECSAIYKESISSLFTYIPDDENYDGIWALTRVLMAGESRKDTPYERMEKDRATVARIISVIERRPEEMAVLLEDARRFDQDRKAAGISIKSFEDVPAWLTATSAVCSMIVALPFLILDAVFALPMWVTAELLCHKFFKDKAFRNTARFAVMLIMTPVYVLISIVVSIVVKKWWLFLYLLSLTLFCYPDFYDRLEEVRRSLSNLKLVRDRDLMRRFRELVSRFSKVT